MTDIFWETLYWGNTIKEYATAFLLFIVLFIFLGLFKKVILDRFKRFAQKSSTDIDDIIVAIIGEIQPPFYSFIALYIALQLITVTDTVLNIVTAILLLWATYLIIRMMRVFIDRVIRNRLGEDDGSTRAAVQLLSAIVTFALWILGILLVLQNLGINITSLIAGLGIGGIAVALALQNVFSDLFSSFSILFDKPFTVGDFIIAGTTSGTVEKIGIKTTRLRAVSGEQIVVSNAQLTSAVIQNYKRMEERRKVFNFGVTYETSAKVLDTIPSIVKEIIEQDDSTRFMSAHFKEFGDSAYVYEVIYYVTTPDYFEYLTIHNGISLKLINAFRNKKIEMAYPTHRVYMSEIK